ncbi:uncharacterized protein LTHEOB_8588 [Lasiodiplodia theobromae]|uniref:uncharacterized protein n=1 Tax=Lasiodiplodia theobromae TaxID=45133 RepID=UPI0015C3F0E8|nr:uncharacterized protein LTHEOB_8588 [Lasiodiplodia theobromae]KAF4541593.1 hypothetical protein LTHEOB_8588 [Lasiodiplodia theobromae]
MCSGIPTREKHSDGLHSSTSSVTVHTTQIGDRTVHLLDTPGFNDSSRTDEAVLHELVFWLLSAHELGIRLNGVVYLHSIEGSRVCGSHRRGLDMFKALIGEEAYPGVVMASSMWNRAKPSEAEARQGQLTGMTGCWGDLIAGGARVMKLGSNAQQARNIVQHFIDQDLVMKLSIQHQLLDLQLELRQTDAGKVLNAQLSEELQRLQRRMEEVERQLDASPKKHDGECVLEMDDELADLEKASLDTQRAIEKLNAPGNSWVSEWCSNVRAELEDMSLINGQTVQRDALGEVERVEDQHKLMDKQDGGICLAHNDSQPRGKSGLGAAIVHASGKQRSTPIDKEDRMSMTAGVPTVVAEAAGAVAAVGAVSTLIPAGAACNVM